MGKQRPLMSGRVPNGFGPHIALIDDDFLTGLSESLAEFSLQTYLSSPDRIPEEVIPLKVKFPAMC